MAESTLLTIAQEFCKRKGLPQPLTVAGTTDDTTLQIWGLMNEGIQDICDRYNFQQLQAITTFQHANGANYLAYDLSLLANTPGWKFMLQDTMWNQSTRLPMGDPVMIKEWMAAITMLAPGSRTFIWTMYNNGVYIFPVPNPVGTTTFMFAYQSKFGVNDPVTGFADSYTSDNSVPRLPTYLILADLKWRWAMAKGLPYAEDQRVSESMLVNAAGREPLQELVLDSDDYYDGPLVRPGLLIPAGNW